MTEASQRDGAPLNIYQRINEIRKRVHYVKKDKEVQGEGYKAVTHDVVTAICRNHLIEFGVVIVPRLIDSSMEEVGRTQKGASIYRYSGRYEVDFVNADDPPNRVTMTTEAHANDSGDKAPGKATSYATKTAMLKMFNIETGENEESRFDVYGSNDAITESQAADLRALAEEVEADIDKFLEYLSRVGKCQIGAIEEIPAKMFKDATAALTAKRKKA